MTQALFSCNFLAYNLTHTPIFSKLEVTQTFPCDEQRIHSTLIGKDLSQAIKQEIPNLQDFALESSSQMGRQNKHKIQASTEPHYYNVLEENITVTQNITFFCL